MRRHRFFIDEKLHGRAELRVTRSDLINQWRKVLRLHEAGEIVLFDGSGFEYSARIKKLGSRESVLEIMSEELSRQRARSLTLYQSLLKKDKFEWVLEKCTEIGVSEFVPIITDRSEKKGINLERARKILVEAAEQSGRGDIPTIGKPVLLTPLLKSIEGSAIVFDPRGAILNNIKMQREGFSAVFVGPEGGWSERELSQFRENGFEIFSFGSQILRAETAAVAASALTLLCG